MWLRLPLSPTSCSSRCKHSKSNMAAEARQLCQEQNTITEMRFKYKVYHKIDASENIPALIYRYWSSKYGTTPGIVRYRSIYPMCTEHENKMASHLAGNLFWNNDYKLRLTFNQRINECHWVRKMHKWKEKKLFWREIRVWMSKNRSYTVPNKSAPESPYILHTTMNTFLGRVRSRED